jgi:hypothetical protein
VGESEARTVTYKLPPTKSDSEHQANLSKMTREKQATEEVLVRVFGSSEKCEVWPGKAYELARQVRDDLRKAGKSTNELTAAFEQACGRYVQRNGKRFTPKSLREGLRQWEDKIKGYK